MDRNVDSLRGVWDRVRDQLESERRRVLAEIHAYPAPIPRCDQQFNHLIEKRDRLSQELAQLDAAAGSSADASRVDAFIDASECLEEDAKQRLRSQLSVGRLVKP